jgi:hypothetical protein
MALTCTITIRSRIGFTSFACSSLPTEEEEQTCSQPEDEDSSHEDTCYGAFGEL